VLIFGDGMENTMAKSMSTQVNKLKKQTAESITDRKYIHRLLKTHASQFQQNTDEHKNICEQLQQNALEHKDMRELLNSMNHIELNGDGKVYTQEGAFREIYSAVKDLKIITKEIKVKKNFKQAYIDWKQNTTIGKIFNTAIGNIMITSIVIFIMLSVLHTLGIEKLNPIKMTADIIKFLCDLIF
jgi:hypothetical protein